MQLIPNTASVVGPNAVALAKRLQGQVSISLTAGPMNDTDDGLTCTFG